MTRQSIDVVTARSPLVRVIPAEDFDMLMDELRYLRAQHTPAETESYDIGRRHEREAIIGWLRSMKVSWSPLILAYAIEGLEHLEDKP
jgi:hypothetical protein